MLSSNIIVIFKSVTLEPVLIFYYTSLALTTVNGQNLLLQKACYPGNSIPPINTGCQNELQSQKMVTEIQTWKQLITLFGPILFVLFAGPWSDNHGNRRKPLMYLPLFGQILSDLLCILNVYFWRWSPEVAALSESIFPAVTGWRSCFVIGVNSYISDITSENTRTMRLGICSAIYFLGTPVGTFIFGLVFRRIGFYGVYLICIISNTLALIYLLILVNESEPKVCGLQLKTCENCLDPKYALQSLRTLFKPRGGYKRATIILAVLLAPMTLAPLQGEFMVLYFYLRYKFHWDETEYGFYSAYIFIIIFFGSLVTLGIFSRQLNISDAMIGIMSSATLILAALGYTFCNTTWELFVYPIVDFMEGAGLAVVTAIVSKNVESTELGQVISMLGVADAVFPLINLPLYNQVYNHTFVQMPGAFFLLSAMYGVIALVLFSVIHFLQKKTTMLKENLQNKSIT